MRSCLGLVRGWKLFLLSTALFGVLATAEQAKNNKATATSGSGKVVLYTGIGNEFTQYDVDVDNATLTKGSSVTLPGGVTETAFHPSKKFLYVVWGGLSKTPNAIVEHGISAFSIDPATGSLTPNGSPAHLPPSPGYSSFISTDVPGTHVLVTHTDPSFLKVFKIEPDGTVGSEVKPKTPLDYGIHAHQVRVDPTNKKVFLMDLGYRPTATSPDWGSSINIFDYKNGELTREVTIPPGGGSNFELRHLDFDPSGRWDFVSLERQNKLLVYKRMSDGSIGSEPLFSKDTLADPSNIQRGQIFGTVHVHPNGKFVYGANRAASSTMVDGKRVFAGGENSIVVYAINQNTGEPTLIQSIDTHGFSPRTFSLDPSGRLLVVSNTKQLYVHDGEGLRLVQPNLAVFRIGDDGKLEFVRSYDVTFSDGDDWAGITSLPK
jgi:6-phosphogluconolactonase